MVQSSSLRFARTVQTLGAAARSLGLVVPGFRTPPRLVGVQRSIKRWAGGATVAVVVRGRPWAAVQADLIDGVLAANHLAPAEADHARRSLWAALEPAAGGPSPVGREVPPARRGPPVAPTAAPEHHAAA